MVPGADASGFVAPIIVRPYLITSLPSLRHSSVVGSQQHATPHHTVSAALKGAAVVHTEGQLYIYILYLYDTQATQGGVGEQPNTHACIAAEHGPCTCALRHILRARD